MNGSKGAELLKFALYDLRTNTPSNIISTSPPLQNRALRSSPHAPTFYNLVRRRVSTPLRLSQRQFTSGTSSKLQRSPDRGPCSSSVRISGSSFKNPPRSRGHSYRDSPSFHHRTLLGADRKQGAIVGWTAIILGGFVVGSILYTTAPGNQPFYKDSKQRDWPESGRESSTFIKISVIEDRDSMAPVNPPGRVGNLTAEQEEKLRELWIAALSVCGIYNPNGENGTTATNGTGKAEGATSKKTKKKRLGVFGRKKGGDDADSVESTVSNVLNSPGKADTDDKYGQTKEFYEALANITPETIRSTFWSMVKMDHPDALLLRFLRARKWDVDKALIMMVSTMRWRAYDAHVDDDIMKNGEALAVEQAAGNDSAKKKFGEDFLAQLRLGKSFLHGVDKENRPMCFVRVRLHRQGEQSEESLERYTVFIIETARLTLAPPVDTAVRRDHLSDFLRYY